MVGSREKSGENAPLRPSHAALSSHPRGLEVADGGGDEGRVSILQPLARILCRRCQRLLLLLAGADYVIEIKCRCGWINRITPR